MATDKDAPKIEDADVPDEKPETDTRTWIVYTDDDGKTHRITVEQYQKKGL